MDILNEIINWIQNFWNNISVWVPVTSLSALAIVFKIVKTILSIITAKKKQISVDEFLNDIKKELEIEKSKLNKSLETLQEYRKIIEELIATQINPAIKEKLLSLFNSVKELETDETTPLLNDSKEHTESITNNAQDQNKDSTIMFTGE